MGIDYIYPQFEVIRRAERCTNCRICERQCANGVHRFDAERKTMVSDESKCVNCQRCVCFCPTHALKIQRSSCALRENDNWDEETVKELYRQAGSGGVLLSSMGNPKRFPVYWDKILINASQVTNPPIDPLREPMETRVFLGRKPERMRREPDGRLNCDLPPQLQLSMPVLFSAMSYGSISYNAHACLARAARELGICYNTGEGGLHEDFYDYGENTIVQVASGRFGVHKRYLNAGAAIEIKMGQGAKPGIGGHLPGAKIVGDISRTRMVPEGTDAVSPAPHHDIYSIEDLRLREEGIRNHVSLIAGGSIRSAADVVKAIALGAGACYIGTAALLALGCHLCRSCQTGLCNWGITTQRPELVKRPDIDEGSRRLVNLMTAWRHEIKEMMGGMGINSVEALRGNRLMLRGIGLTDRELHILGISHAGE